jgi:hypothetical protein
MQDEHIVRDLHVSDGSQTIKASYFVDGGILYVRIEGRTHILPIGQESSEDTIRRLVIGQMQTRTWRERMLQRLRDRRL